MNREDSKTMQVGLYQVLVRNLDEFRLAWGPDEDGDFWVLHNNFDGVEVISTHPSIIESIEPVVYIPANEHDMSILIKMLRSRPLNPGDLAVANRLADAVEKQLAPEPPKVPEPTGLGAVIKCKYGQATGQAVRGARVTSTTPWTFIPDAGRPITGTAWSYFKDITVLSHGVDCTCAGPH